MEDKWLIIFKSYITDKAILQMVRGNVTEFESDNPRKHNGKNPSFPPEEEVEIQVILEEILHEKIIRKAAHESTRIFLSNFYS